MEHLKTDMSEKLGISRRILTQGHRGKRQEAVI